MPCAFHAPGTTIFRSKGMVPSNHFAALPSSAGSRRNSHAPERSSEGRSAAAAPGAAVAPAEVTTAATKTRAATDREQRTPLRDGGGSEQLPSLRRRMVDMGEIFI